MIRGRLVLAGITDPLRQLPTLFALLDVVETMILDGMTKEEERTRYWTRTYSPPAGASRTLAAKPPPGWDADSEMELFESNMDD